METYKIHTKCTNCAFKSIHPSTMLEIVKGRTISEALEDAECTNCGCKTLVENRDF